MKINRLNLGRLFYNNKVVMFFSIIFAFIGWIILSTSSSETTTKIITDIPITVPLSESAKESGLTVFGTEDIKAEIPVSGNRLILGQLTKNDIQITAQQSANMITSTGKYTLELSAKKNSLLTDYEISSSVSPKFITVVVDRYKSKTFEITPNIKYTANTDYFVAPIALSEPNVTISGPESLISSIDKASVEGSVPGTINNNVDLNNLPINLFDHDGNKINTKNLTLSITKVNATISILQRKFVDIKPQFTSIPSGLNIKDLSVQVIPSTVEIAASNDTFKNINKITLDSIDFSKINLEHSQFEQSLNVPADYRNLNNTYNSTVKINLSGFQARTITANNIVFKNLPSNRSASSHTMSLPIQVIGPSGQIRSLSPSDIFIEVDLSGKEEFSGRTEMPAKITFNASANKCWAYGTYKVNVGITKN